MNFRGNDSITDCEEFVWTLTSLWDQMCEMVYLKEGQLDRERVLHIWNETKYSPLQYIQFYGDPKLLTNRIGRGQKAREKRWGKWWKKIINDPITYSSSGLISFVLAATISDVPKQSS